MTTAATSLLGLALPVTSELAGTWGDVVNNSLTSLLDTAIAGTTTLSTDADVTLTTTTLASNQARQAILLCSGARTALRTITAPAASKIYTIINATTGGYSVKLVGVGPTTGLTIPNGASAVVAWNGSDFIEVGSATVGNLTVNGNLTVTGTTSLTGVATLTANPVLSAGTANGVAYLNGSKSLTTGSALVFDGANLGVGTASPAQRFHVATAGAVISLTENTASTAGARNRVQNTLSYLDVGQDSTGGFILQNGAYPIVFYTNGTEAMRLTSTGLGIGTSTVSYGLSLRKDPSSSTTQMLQIDPSTRTNSAYMQFNNNGAGTFNIGRADSAGGFAGPTISAYDSFIWNTSTQNILFGTNNLERMRLDSSGNLGLGVTPSAWRTSEKAFQIGTVGSVSQISGAVKVNGNAYWNSSNQAIYLTSDLASNYTQTSGVHQWLIAPTGTAGNAITFTQAMTLDASGNLAVGSTSVARGRVYVNSGASVNALAVQSSTTGVYLEFADVSTPTWSNSPKVGAINNDLIFSANGAERARIDSSGRLLVGQTSYSTTTDGVALQASGSVFARSGTGASTNINIANGNGVVGTITTSGTSTAYNTSSDYRLKESIAPMTGALAKVAALKPVTYKWKSDGSDGEGFIAHELQAVVPQCVTGEKDAVDAEGNPQYQGIDTSFLVATLTAAIQEQQAIIEQLKADVAALKAN